ncbi:MAG TPA: DUF3558 domain-containing protein [Kutzneria sp.]|nr:DUF3558 domain-containing protein [Kutzneria sp.]
MAFVLAAVAVAGCSPTTDPGHPEPTSTTSASGSGKPQLSRPKDLKIADVDPCSLLTDAQKTQMNITHTGPGPGSTEDGSPSSCSYTVLKPTEFSLNVALDSKLGIEDWLGGKYEGQDLRQLSVQSYPAAQTLLLTEKFSDPNAGGCQTLVSTAAGQELHASAQQGLKKGLTTTQLCDLSKQLAGLALTTLLANQ